MAVMVNMTCAIVCAYFLAQLKIRDRCVNQPLPSLPLIDGRSPPHLLFLTCTPSKLNKAGEKHSAMLNNLTSNWGPSFLRGLSDTHTAFPLYFSGWFLPHSPKGSFHHLSPPISPISSLILTFMEKTETIRGELPLSFTAKSTNLPTIVPLSFNPLRSLLPGKTQPCHHTPWVQLPPPSLALSLPNYFLFLLRHHISSFILDDSLHSTYSL